MCHGYRRERRARRRNEQRGAGSRDPRPRRAGPRHGGTAGSEAGRLVVSTRLEQRGLAVAGPLGVAQLRLCVRRGVRSGPRGREDRHHARRDGPCPGRGGLPGGGRARGPGGDTGDRRARWRRSRRTRPLLRPVASSARTANSARSPPTRGRPTTTTSGVHGSTTTATGGGTSRHPPRSAHCSRRPTTRHVAPVSGTSPRRTGTTMIPFPNPGAHVGDAQTTGRPRPGRGPHQRLTRPGGENFTVTVLIDLATLLTGTLRYDSMCRFESGPDVTPDLVRRLAEEGTLEILWHREGVPLKLGRSFRLANRHQRRVLRFRDGGCAVPGCSQTRFVHVHHVHHWENGGATDLDNEVMLCSHHHRLVHHGGWTIRSGGDQSFTFFDRQGHEVGNPLVEHLRSSGRPPPGTRIVAAGSAASRHRGSVPVPAPEANPSRPSRPTCGCMRC